MQQTRRFGVVDLILTSSGGFSQSSHQSGCIRCTVSSEEDHPSPVATSPSVREWPRGPGDSIRERSTTEAQSLDGSSSCLFTTRSDLICWLRGGSNSCHVTRGVGLPARLRMRIFSCVQAGGSCWSAAGEMVKILLALVLWFLTVGCQQRQALACPGHNRQYTVRLEGNDLVLGISCSSTLCKVRQSSRLQHLSYCAVCK